MATYQQITLKTAAGGLQFTQREPAEKSTCSFCGKDTTETVAITSTANKTADQPARRFSSYICGDCLAKGLAIAAGNSYVSADGDVEDLRFDDHVFGTAHDKCVHCGRSKQAIESSGDRCSGRAS